MKKRGLSDAQFGYLLVLPSLVFIGMIFLYPVVRNFWLSFYKLDYTAGGYLGFIGINNFKKILTDGLFWSSLRFTILFTVISVPIEFALGLVFALVANTKFKGRNLVRASILVPWALPTAVMAMGWQWIFNGMYGVFNDFLMRLHIISFPVSWLAMPNTAIFSVLFADIWKTTSFMFLLLLAGLQSIPDELYEAANIDGASGIKKFTYITLPLLRSSIVLAFLFRTIQAFGVFDLIWVLTGGGPGDSTKAVSIHIYNTVFRYLNLGYGAALIVVLFIIMIPFAFGYARIAWREE
jgi:multiple sugar transport system permease protein